jgi:diguanylate cyclase (GGDEF)-like protein
MRSRVAVRLAVAGLTIGLVALTTLALFGAGRTAQATSRVRQFGQVSDAWGQVFLTVNVESEALNDYLRAGTDVGRQPLVSALGSAKPALQWLASHSPTEDQQQALLMDQTYQAYTDTLRQVVEAGNRGDQASVAAQAAQASLGASSLARQAVSNVGLERLKMNEYLAQVDAFNRKLKLIATVLFIIDFLLLALCAFVLLSHQRRIQRQAQESRHQALHDGLTGIANRVLLIDRIEQALRAAERHDEFVALLLLDLNRFKEINDTLGHHAGDTLLKEVANRLGGAVREYDTVARLGGDEFAILLPRVGSPERTREVADRVLAAVQRPADLDGMIVDVTGSIGSAVYPVHSTTAIELLQHADIAMYTAKRGRLGTAMYDPAADQHSAAQLSLLGELRHAIGNGQLVLHYQPLARTGSGRTFGVEALVRWQHPTHGLLPPGEFIPQAEDSDLIQPLTDEVLAQALRQHGEWRDAGMLVPISVNVATRCLLDTAFPDRVAALLAGNAVTPDQLTLEITESAVITDPVSAGNVLGRLRELGVRLSIDDFGTGYSSMTYLQNMPLSELKIDRRFIAALDSSRSNEAIVRAIIQMAHALDLEVVAEGVEDAATLAALGTMGCDIAQGYYLCRPVPAAELTRWLTARTGGEDEVPAPREPAEGAPQDARRLDPAAT